MGWNDDGNYCKCACKGCEERYPACHSECAKYAEFKERVAKVNEEKKKHGTSSDLISDERLKTIWKKQRYSKQRTYSRFCDR